VTRTNHRRKQKPELRVVFDSNVLHNLSASEIVRQEVVSLIKDSAYPDLDIQWYLPEIVRHERQFQMQKKALEMLPTIAKLEHLLGHNLAISAETLIDGVEKAISRRQEELGLRTFILDTGNVDWRRVLIDSAYRKPPFREGEKEKGFRDSLVAESFVQLACDSPRTPEVCRIVLVTEDKLLADAVKERTPAFTNTSVVPNLEELKGLINTLVSRMDENFLALLKPKADRLFFTQKDQSSLYYKFNIREKLTEKFKPELEALPTGALWRKNGTWRISPPNFVKKSGRRIQWTSRIEVEAEATKLEYKSPPIDSPRSQIFTSGNTVSLGSIGKLPNNAFTVQNALYGNNVSLADLSKQETILGLPPNLEYVAPPIVVTTHKGSDVYEILWGTTVTTSRDLRAPSIDEIRHVETLWEASA
jgi:hypothetical protein